MSWHMAGTELHHHGSITRKENKSPEFRSKNIKHASAERWGEPGFKPRAQAQMLWPHC